MIELFALMLALLAVLLYELKRRVPIWALSPVWLVIGGHLAMGLAGRCMLRYARAWADQEFLFVTFSRSALDRTLLWFLFATVSFSSGALLSIWASQRPDLPVEFTSDVERRGGGGGLLLAACVTLALFVIGAGPENVLNRGAAYQTGGGTVAKILGAVFTPLAVGLCGYMALSFERKLVRFGGMLVAVGYFLLTFSLATRFMALVPLFFALGAFCARPGRANVRLMFYASLAAVPVLLPIPLVLRNQVQQGLIPFASELKTGTVLLAHGSMTRTVLGNLLLSFPLTTFVGYGRPLGTSVLLTSVSPMPGRLTDWYKLEPTLFASFSTPYNATGMLMNYGLLVSGGFYMTVGFYLSHADWRIRRSFSGGQAFKALLLFGLSSMFLLTALMYPLRAACRPIYYAIAFEAVTALVFPDFSGRPQLARPPGNCLS